MSGADDSPKPGAGARFRRPLILALALGALFPVAQATARSRRRRRDEAAARTDDRND